MTHGATPDALLWTLLGAVVLPAWLLAGVCDYLAHARSAIERTSGVHESLLHLLQTAQIGVPTLAILFLELNSAVLLLCVAGVLAHSVTAWRDLRYTNPLREVTVFEQYVHAFLIVLPLMSLALLVAIHWPGAAPEAAWRLQPRAQAFAPAVIAAVLAASAVFGVLPGLWELARCWRARTRSGVRSGTSHPHPHPQPHAARVLNRR
jgi:hypothetical protein